MKNNKKLDEWVQAIPMALYAGGLAAGAATTGAKMALMPQILKLKAGAAAAKGALGLAARRARAGGQQAPTGSLVHPGQRGHPGLQVNSIRQRMKNILQEMTLAANVGAYPMPYPGGRSRSHLLTRTSPTSAKPRKARRKSPRR